MVAASLPVCIASKFNALIFTFVVCTVALWNIKRLISHVFSQLELVQMVLIKHHYLVLELQVILQSSTNFASTDP